VFLSSLPGDFLFSNGLIVSSFKSGSVSFSGYLSTSLYIEFEPLFFQYNLRMYLGAIIFFKTGLDDLIGREAHAGQATRFYPFPSSRQCIRCFFVHFVSLIWPITVAAWSKA
jgi:hypothetical protein